MLCLFGIMYNKAKPEMIRKNYPGIYRAACKNVNYQEVVDAVIGKRQNKLPFIKYLTLSILFGTIFIGQSNGLGGGALYPPPVPKTGKIERGTFIIYGEESC